MANSSIALNSSLNLRSIKKSLSGLTNSVNSARSSVSNVRKSLFESNREKRQSISASGSLFRKRREATLRRQKEDLIEARSIGGAVKRTGKVVMNSTKGFFGRILEYVGLVLVGWAVNNLPKIMKLVSDLIGRMQKYFGILRDFVGGVTEVLSGFGQVLGGIYTSITTNNFNNYQTQMTSGLQRIQSGMDQLTNSTLQGVSMLTQDASTMLKAMGIDLSSFQLPGLEPEPEPEPQNQGGGNTNNQGGGNTNNQGGSAGPYPDPKSAEMYRIAAALYTEGTSEQGYADMMQVVANRKAMGYAGGGSYTDILAAGTGGINVAFAGVWNRPGGPNGLRKIQTLSDAAKWAGQSEGSILRIISLMTDPARQASAASFVGGALEFRASPAGVRSVNSDNDPTNDIQADRNGIIPGSVWRGTNKDNQFITGNPPGAAYIPVRPGGAAPLNLPKGQPPKPTNTTNTTNNNNNQPPPKGNSPIGGSLLETFFNIFTKKGNTSSYNLNYKEPIASNTIIIKQTAEPLTEPEKAYPGSSPDFNVAKLDVKNVLNSDDMLMLKIG